MKNKISYKIGLCGRPPKFYILTPEDVPLGLKYMYGPNRTFRTRFIEDNSIRRQLFFEEDGAESQILDTPLRTSIIDFDCNKSGKEISLGKGGFGSVFLSILNDELVACKKIKLNSRSNIASLARERNGLGLCHPNLIQVFATYAGLKAGLVVMEKASSTNLQEILTKSKIRSDRTKIRYTRQICLGLQYLHSNGILHLDVKPQNVLVNLGSNCIKLADFGNSALIDGLGSFISLGTIRYSPPEFFTKDPVTTKSDVFSVGITMWQLLFNKIPYDDGETNSALLYQIVKRNLRPKPHDHPFSPQLRGMRIYQETYKRCWEAHQDRRPFINIILQNLDLSEEEVGRNGEWVERLYEQ
ncbi:serine/threonine-protein kinase mos [Neocloeon triangulifer]|uniref:serine/threonine-protein kinase mos n=1 Tax=Neocloeon triangulifer TaxID=2078957 RepID=UPI00286F875D|nr:serine/threonine-protein kinase mos [Neocloeon triangulifer]